MVDSTTGESETRDDVVPLEVRQLCKDLLNVEARRQEIEDVGDANSHPSDARSTAALISAGGDSLEQIVHCLVSFPWFGSAHAFPLRSR